MRNLVISSKDAYCSDWSEDNARMDWMKRGLRPSWCRSLYCCRVLRALLSGIQPDAFTSRRCRASSRRLAAVGLPGEGVPCRSNFSSFRSYKRRAFLSLHRVLMWNNRTDQIGLERQLQKLLFDIFQHLFLFLSARTPILPSQVSVGCRHITIYLKTRTCVVNL